MANTKLITDAKKTCAIIIMRLSLCLENIRPKLKTKKKTDYIRSVFIDDASIWLFLDINWAEAQFQIFWIWWSWEPKTSDKKSLFQ